MTAPLSRFPLIQLRHLSAVPITNGLGEAGNPANHAAWPRYIRTTDIATVRALDHNKRVTLPPEIADEARVLRGDILMTSAGTVGKSYLHLTDEIACFAGYLSRLRVRSDRALPEFVAYWTESSHYTDQVQSGAVKSTIENFSAAKYRAMRIPVPTLQEQRAIADYLDRETAQIDAFIAKNEELMALLTERRLSAVTAAVTEAAAGPLIALRNLGSVLDCKHVTAEFAAGNGSFAVASVREVAGRWVNIKNARRTTEESFRSLGEGGRTLKAWDLLVCRNTSVGKVSIVPADIELTVMGQDVSLIRTFNGDRDVSRFLYYVLTSAVGSDGFERASIGSTFKRINVDDIKSLRVPQVDPKTARRVADGLDALTSRIDEAILSAERGARLARERRAALISAAVTGKIDLGAT